MQLCSERSHCEIVVKHQRTVHQCKGGRCQHHSCFHQSQLGILLQKTALLA